METETETEVNDEMIDNIATANQGMQEMSLDTSEVYTVNECLEMFRTNFHIYRKTLYGTDTYVQKIFEQDFLKEWRTLPHLLFVGHDKSPLSEIAQTFIQSIFEKEGILSAHETITKTVVSFACKETNQTPVKYYTCPYYIDIPICRYASHARAILREVIQTKMHMRNIAYENHKHIIMLRGIDSIKPSFQKAFLRVMEKYNRNVLFICTANQANKVIPPMLSRMMNIRCPLPTNQAILNCLGKIRRHMTLDVQDEILSEITTKSARDIRSAVSMMSAYLMVEDVKLFDEGMLEETILTLIRKMLRTQIPLNIMDDTRKTYYVLAAHNMPFHHMCFTVCKCLTQMRPAQAHEITKIVAHADHRACLGSKALLHFESMIYQLFKITH
jgi:DNA polymerase III delta prime subunit